MRKRLHCPFHIWHASSVHVKRDIGCTFVDVWISRQLHQYAIHHKFVATDRARTKQKKGEIYMKEKHATLPRSSAKAGFSQSLVVFQEQLHTYTYTSIQTKEEQGVHLENDQFAVDRRRLYKILR
jgi:hypothetical protein